MRPLVLRHSRLVSVIVLMLAAIAFALPRAVSAAPAAAAPAVPSHAAPAPAAPSAAPPSAAPSAAPAAPAAPSAVPASPAAPSAAPAASAAVGKPAAGPPPPPAAGAKRSFTDAIPCSACHTTSGWKSKDGAGGDDSGFDHSTTGFPLSGQHIRVSCVTCHNASKPIKRDCVSCHDDFHRGRLSSRCDTCHSPMGWKATRPLEIHRMTRFPLTGMHVLADCSECHRRASEHRWTGAPIDCFACHETQYRRPDVRPVHIGTATTAPFPRDCSQCHRALAWVPAILSGPLAGVTAAPLRAAPAGHDLRFPISFGLHRTAACDDCHTSPVASRAVRCIGCHAHDPVRLMQQHRQPVGMDGASCLSCHPGGARR